MSTITGKTLAAFREGANSVLDNFTGSEIEEMDRMAERIKTIFDAAKQRQQEKLSKH
jgi:hypothetical protein